MDERIYENFGATAPAAQIDDSAALVQQISEDLESDYKDFFSTAMDSSQPHLGIGDLRDIADRASMLDGFKSFVKELEENDENQQKAAAAKLPGILQLEKGTDKMGKQGVGGLGAALGTGGVAGGGGGGK